MKKLNSLTMVLIASVALGACALSPQTITLKPAIDARSHPIGRSRELALEVVDLRPTQHFGSRGGVYGETALLNPQTDVVTTVRRALAERLTASQFAVTPPNANAPLALRVEIQRIDYIARGEPIVNEVRAVALIRAIVRNGGRTLTSQYQANTARRVVGPPGEAANEAILNEVMGKVLQRLLQDGAVLDLLNQ